jgi:hypothetical protein
VKSYGKLLVSAYLIRKINSWGSIKSGGVVNKYGKLVLGAYILEKLKSEKSLKELEPEELELNESGKGSAMKKIGKIMMGAIVGATAVYALKKYTTKKSGYKIAVE